MKRLSRLVLLLCLLLPAAFLSAQEKPQSPSATQPAARPVPAAPAGSVQVPPTVTSTYSLSGEKLQKAIRLTHIRIAVHFVTAIWDILALILLLQLGIIAKFRDWAVGAGANRWLQALVFVPLFVITLTIVDLPIDIFMEHVNHLYGMSVQSWPGWAWDATKSLLLAIGGLYLFLMLLRWLIRKLPRAWWFASWLVMLPILVFLLFVEPMVIEPMFNKFDQLAKANPTLVVKLQEVLQHGGVTIPPTNFKLMHASEKTTQLNAYVSGIGASKQVVVYDTIANKLTPEELQFVVGHELGHYVLHHIPKETSLACLLMLVLFYLGYRFVHWAIARWGTKWKVPDQSDWVAIAVFLLAFNILGFITEPVTNGMSRHFEHEADVYGMEAIHGIVANPQAVASHSFQVLGETSLVDPNPNPFVEFWVGNHPSITSRVKFAAEYDPWAEGKTPKFFQK